MELKNIFFNAKIIKMGCSNGVIIPYGLVQNLKKDHKYKFTITEE